MVDGSAVAAWEKVGERRVWEKVRERRIQRTLIVLGF